MRKDGVGMGNGEWGADRHDPHRYPIGERFGAKACGATVAPITGSYCGWRARPGRVFGGTGLTGMMGEAGISCGLWGGWSGREGQPGRTAGKDSRESYGAVGEYFLTLGKADRGWVLDS